MVLGHVFTKMQFIWFIGCQQLYAITHVFLNKFGVPGLQCKLNENEQFWSKLTNLTLGAETVEKFANFVPIRESLRRKKFYIDRFAKVYARKIFHMPLIMR